MPFGSEPAAGRKDPFTEIIGKLGKVGDQMVPKRCRPLVGRHGIELLCRDELSVRTHGLKPTAAPTQRGSPSRARQRANERRGRRRRSTLPPGWARIVEVGGKRHLDLADRPREVLRVVGDESIGTRQDSGREVRGVERP